MSMAMTEYRAIPAISASDIKKMKRSMAHWRYWKDNPQPSMLTQEFGTAVHMAVCEPNKFNDYYAVFDDTEILPKCLTKECELSKTPRNTAMYRDFAAEFGAKNAGKAILTAEDYTRIIQISKTVHARPTVGEWLSDPASKFEHVLQWQHGGIPMKMRADHILGNMIIDYKTTTDARHSAFSRTMYNFGYNLQGAVYCEGAEANGITDPIFILVAIETDPPHGIMVYELDKATLDHSKLEVEELLYKYEMCVKEGIWTCYDENIKELDLPLYAYSD